MELSAGEKLILIMLSEIHEHLKIKDGIDPQFVREAIYEEHLWSLPLKYPGLVGSSESVMPHFVSEVFDILEMWEQLEVSYNQLQPADKEKVASEAKLYGSDVRFRGFDGNHETEYMGAAYVLIDDLDRYTTFKGRDLNSHMPSLDTYRRMLEVYFPIRSSGLLDGLSVEQLIHILNA